MNQKSTPELLTQVAQARIFNIVVQTTKIASYKSKRYIATLTRNIHVGCSSRFGSLCGRGNPAEQTLWVSAGNRALPMQHPNHPGNNLHTPKRAQLESITTLYTDRNECLDGW